MHLQEMTALAGTTCMHLLAFGPSCVQKAPKKRGSAIITAFLKQFKQFPPLVERDRNGKCKMMVKNHKYSISYSIWEFLALYYVDLYH